MKVIIPAAGRGTRLGNLTDSRPKAMVPVRGKTLLDRQIDSFQDVGLYDITVVTGHFPNSVTSPHATFFRMHNPMYEMTNMVYSIFCCEEYFDGTEDILISYGDIGFHRSVLEQVLAASNPLATVIDRDFKKYWFSRSADPLSDLENCSYTGDRMVKLGGRATFMEDIQGQYIGMTVISSSVACDVRDHWNFQKADRRKQISMTEFLQSLIDSGIDITPVLISGGWFEIDTPRDLEIAESIVGSWG